MSSYEIKAIHTSSTDDVQRIESVKLSSGETETVPQVIRYIDLGMEYFYTSSYSSKSLVESVHPQYGQPYIRTKGNATTRDNLLSLPRF